MRKEIQIRWERGLWGRPSTHRGFGPCVWILLPFGGLCMHSTDINEKWEMRNEKWDMRWDRPHLSVVVPGRDVTQIVRHCPSDEVRIWSDYPLGTYLMIVFDIQYLIWWVLWFRRFYADFYNIVFKWTDLN